VDYKIRDTTLSHTYDLACLSNRIEELFGWYSEQDPKKKYIGPYLCFVQSSGMGKTKLLFEYRNLKARVANQEQGEATVNEETPVVAKQKKRSSYPEQKGAIRSLHNIADFAE